MVNKPLIRPYFWGGVALGGVARIPLNLKANPSFSKAENTPKEIGQRLNTEKFSRHPRSWFSEHEIPRIQI